MATTPRKTRATSVATPTTETSTRRKAAAGPANAPAARRTRDTAEAPARKRPAKATAADPTGADPTPAAPPVRKLRARGPSAVAAAESDASPRRRSRTLTTPVDSAAKRPRSSKPVAVEMPETPKRHRAKVGEAIVAEAPRTAAGRSRKAVKPSTPTPTEVVEQLKQVVLGALDDMKARELLILDVRPLTSMFDWRIIVTGTSNRHLSSMAEEVSKRAKAIGLPPMYISGDRESDWVLVDLGDIVVDLMSDQARKHYALEKLWQVAPPAGG